MTLELPEELQVFLEEEVRAGHYASVSEAIAAAVVGLRFQQEQASELDQAEISELRKFVDAGLTDLDAGRFADFTAEDIMAEGRASRHSV